MKRLLLSKKAMKVTSNMKMVTLGSFFILGKLGGLSVHECRFPWMVVKPFRSSHFQRNFGRSDVFSDVEKRASASSSLSLRKFSRVDLFHWQKIFQTHQLLDFKLTTIAAKNVYTSMFRGTMGEHSPSWRLEANEPHPHTLRLSCVACEIRAEVGFKIAAPCICYQKFYFFSLILLR